MAGEVWAAGAPISTAETLIRRYVGLPFADGRREVWGYEYYDARPSPADNEIQPEDVTSTSALGMRFSQRCLQGWTEERPRVRGWLEQLSPSLEFAQASDEDLEVIEAALEDVIAHVPDTDRTMVSKVLHRKRPFLVPIYDRVVADRYARGLGDRRFGRGMELLHAIRSDLEDGRNQSFLDEMTSALREELGAKPVPSKLRLFDIAVWMESRAPP